MAARRLVQFTGCVGAVLLLVGCGSDASPADGSSLGDAAVAEAGIDAGTSTDGGASDANPPIDGGPTGDAGNAACEEPFMTVNTPLGEPPFSGTSFLTTDLITDSDPSSFVDLTYAGQGMRTMFDRRTNSFSQENAHLFDARFGATKVIEIQVNPEMSRNDAETEARFYAEVVGRLPGFLFRDLETFWIHRGTEPFGGGNDNLLIHTGMGEGYAASGVLEEILVHEASHTSMDSYHASDPRWLEAVAADGVALSTYARDNPAREDVAETVGPYLAVRFRRSRVAPAEATTIEGAIPNRLQYLDCIGINLDPLR